MSDEAHPGVRPDPAAPLVEHFFRHEYRRLVAQLAHKVGVRHIELVEDAVQSALAAALTAWVAKGLPRDPGAWLYRAACNHLIGTLRKGAGQSQVLERAAGDIAIAAAEDPMAPRFAGEVRALGLWCETCASARAAVAVADIVVSSVPAAPGFAPFLDGAWLKPGVFVSMVDLGRSWKRETIRDLDVMATDDRVQSRMLAADGKLAHAGPWPADLTDLVAGSHPGRTDPDERTGFVFAGLALADLAVAALAYRRALAAGIGTRLEP